MSAVWNLIPRTAFNSNDGLLKFDSGFSYHFVGILASTELPGTPGMFQELLVSASWLVLTRPSCALCFILFHSDPFCVVNYWLADSTWPQFQMHDGRFSFRTCWKRASQQESETHSHTMTPSPPCRVLVDVDDMECSVGLQLSVLDTIFDSHEHLNFAKRIIQFVLV